MTATERGRAIAASVLAAAALLGAAPAAAQIYKWVDEEGTIHFTDAPPARAGNAVEVLPATTPRPRPTAARAALPPEDDAAPRDEAAAPSDAEHLDDDWGEEPELEVEDVATEIIVESGPDPAVRRRANSPRNRPGEPIRQPGGQSVQRPLRGR